MIEVTIQNFQAIRQVSLKIDGFTALVGRSNIGKSAIVRAVRCALTGATGTDFVRHDPETCKRLLRGNKKCLCQATVEIKMNGLALKWEKGDAINQYTVRGVDGKKTVYTKVERGTPEFLQPDFSMVKVGDEKTLVQVSEQFNPIFLLNQSGSVVADVLSDVAKLDDINVAMRLAEKDRREAVSTRKVREKDVLTLQTELAEYDGLDDVVGRVREVETGHETVQEATGKLRKLVEYQESAKAKATEARALKAAVAPKLPDHDALVEAQEKLALLEDLCQRSSRLWAAVEALETATKPEMPDHDALVASQARAAEVRGFADRLKTVRTAVKDLTAAQEAELPDSEPIETSFKKMQQIGVWVQRLRQFKRDMAGSKEVRQPLSDPEALEKSLASFRKVAGIHQQHADLTADLASLEKRLAAAAQEKEALEQEFTTLGACPTCSQRLEPGHGMGHE